MGDLNRLLPFLILVIVLVLTAFSASVNSEAETTTVGATGDKFVVSDAYELDPTIEFAEFCEKQNALRLDPESAKDDCKRIGKKDFHLKDLRMIFALFIIILWGALCRTVIRAFNIHIPYTVVVMVSGLLIGIISKYYCEHMHTFTALARIKPEIILYTFLPVLIFETAFGISSHTFLKASNQILLAALPGLLICTILTALMCFQFFHDYQWTFVQALFYGSIISATDPVAVVAILKELGVAESLSVIIDGESLLNDGVAILLYEIFKDILSEEHEMSTGELAEKVSIMFIRIAIGGPVFGYFMAKITIFCLARIFNDAVVEITLTLVGAYLTYYIAEDVLHVSGVIAVVLLGITMSSEKTCISPEILEEVHEFWEMLSYLANTVLFFITGIIITERGSRDLTLVDLWYLLLLYCAINFIRFIMLLMLSPLLSRMGYGLTWQNLIVMMWGGLRGAVGICLSLQVYEDPKFCDSTKLGPKVMFQTAGIVLLTLTINGTTTKKLLDLLKLTAVSAGRIDEMQIAVRHVMDSQKKAVIMLKHDRFLADASWDYIHQFTKLENPYRNAQILMSKPRHNSSLISLKEETHQHACPNCKALVDNELSNEEYRIMTEESRLRVIKAMKISYWKQYEQGVLTEEAVKLLVSVADSITDKELVMIHTKDLKKYWQIKGLVPWMRSKMMAQFGIPKPKLPKPPENACRRPFYWLASRSWFDNFMTTVVVLNLVPAFWEFALDITTNNSNSIGTCDQLNQSERQAFKILNWIFFIIYFSECFTKMVGLGCKDYWTNKWNYIDFLVLIVTLVDVVVSFYPCWISHSGSGAGLAKFLRGLRLFRVIRSIRLIKPMVPAFLSFLNRKINKTIFLGYDIAVGYIAAIDDVLKYLKHMIENPRVLRKIRASLETEHLEAVRELGFIQKDHPGIALAVKTRHASRSILNQMRTALQELRMDGLLDDKENGLLTIEIEERMKRLWNSPAYIPPSSPEVLLENLSWVYGNHELKDFIFSNATLVTFALGDEIITIGDEPNGIFVIVSGMVRITFEPTSDTIEDREKYGVIPNMEIFRDFEFNKHAEDFYSFGTVIGESGVLTKRLRGATVSCETDGVTAYHISSEIMYEALQTFNDPYDSLETRLWRSCGIRRGGAFFPTTNFYESWTIDKLQMHLERSCVPIGPQFSMITLPPYVLDIFVIEGIVQDYFTGDLFIAPSLISRACTKIISVDNPKTVNRILMITQEKLGNDAIDNDLSRFVLASRQYRRGFDDEQQVDDLFDPSKKRFSLTFNFGIRQRKHRNSSYYPTDDESLNQDPTIRRRKGSMSTTSVVRSGSVKNMNRS